MVFNCIWSNLIKKYSRIPHGNYWLKSRWGWQGMAIKSYQACNPITACHPRTFKTHLGTIFIQALTQNCVFLPKAHTIENCRFNVSLSSKTGHKTNSSKIYGDFAFTQPLCLATWKCVINILSNWSNEWGNREKSCFCLFAADVGCWMLVLITHYF